MPNFLFIKPQVIRENMMNNDDMVKTFVAMYLDQSQADFDALLQAVASADLDEIASKAHHIKPTMEYIGASDTRKKFQQIEAMAREKQSFSEISLQIDLLSADFKTLMAELQSFYSSLGV